MRTRYLLAVPIVAGLALLMALPCSAGDTPSKEKIAKLIEQMGSGNFAERENATKELAEIGVPALEALRKAAKNDDAEVRKRAEELLPKIERQAESARVLAPKRVRLVYKDKPVKDALADFQKQSGYSMELHDPDGKLKERKLTLDTGDVTFWHAFHLFCAKAELTEASLAELMQQQAPGGAGAPPPRPAFPGVNPAALQQARLGIPGMPARIDQILLKDGKPKKLPTDDRCAVRIRALTQSDQFSNAPADEILLPLEVAPEPKLQWEYMQSIHIDKALDDRGQSLTQVVPQVEGVVGAGGGLPEAQQIRLRRQMAQMQRQMQLRRQGMPMMAGNPNHQVSVQFKKGAKETKSLKELKGTITAQLLSEAQPLIVADKLKAGESFKGKDGGFIKIVDVKSEGEETAIRLEFEHPPFDKVMPEQQNVMQFFPGAGVAPIRIQAAPGNKKMPVPPPPPAAPPGGLAAKPQAAPPPVQGQIIVKGGMAFGGAAQFMDSFNGLSVRDDKDNMLPARVQIENSFQQQAGGVFKQTTTYTFTCRRDKDKGQPAKVVYRGRKRVAVEIPFALTDVPLP